MCKFHFRLIVNTSAGPAGFKILRNNLKGGNSNEKLSFIQAKIIQESKTQDLESDIGKTPFSSNTAGNLAQSMNAKYQESWFVIAVENDEFYSVSYLSGVKEHLDITYKGVRWFIYSL